MDADRRWAYATWEGAAEESLRAGARLTMAERLAWLQEIGRLAEHVKARREARSAERADRIPAASGLHRRATGLRP
jgi:uncharacterized protein YciW